VRLPGLAPDAPYRVEIVHPGRGPHGIQPTWMATGVVLTGRVLATVGVEAPSLDPDRSVLLRAVRG
jgi:alpha-galactosidase